MGPSRVPQSHVRLYRVITPPSARALPAAADRRPRRAVPAAPRSVAADVSMTRVPAPVPHGARGARAGAPGSACTRSTTAAGRFAVGQLDEGSAIAEGWGIRHGREHAYSGRLVVTPATSWSRGPARMASRSTRWTSMLAVEASDVLARELEQAPASIRPRGRPRSTHWGIVARRRADRVSTCPVDRRLRAP